MEYERRTSATRVDEDLGSKFQKAPWANRRPKFSTKEKSRPGVPDFPLGHAGTHAAYRLGYYAKKYAIRAQDFPNACVAEDWSITLPIFPDMTDEQVAYVAQQIADALKPA